MRKPLITILLLSLIVLCFSEADAKTEEDYQEEIQMLKAENVQLEDRLEELSAELKQSDLTIKTLKKQIDVMTLEAEAQTQEIQETQQAMRQVKEQLTALLEQQNESQIKQLEQQLTTALQRIQELEQELQAAKSESKTQQTTISTLEEEKAAVEKEKANIEKALTQEKAKSEPDKYQEELDNVQAELEKQREQFKATLKLLQDREAELETAQASIQTLKAQLAAAAAPKDVDRRVEELEAMLADVNAKLINVAQEKDVLESQLAQAQHGEGQIQERDAEITRLEGELLKAADYINARTAEIVALTQEKTALEAQLNELSTNKDGIETRLSKSLEERSRTIQQLESDVARLQASLEHAENRQQEAEKKAAEAVSKMQELDEKLQYQSSVPDAAKIRIQELTQELQDVKSRFETDERIKKEFPILQQDLATCREQAATLLQTEDQNQALKSDLQERQFTIERLQDEIDLLSEVNLDLQAQLKQAKTATQTTMQECRDSIVQNEDLEELYANSQKELQLKEQVLQQTLTEKALIEKKLDEGDSSFEALRTKLRQAEAKNLALQEQLLTFQQSQAQVVQNQHGATSAQAMLQQQLQQEQTRRKQVEVELLETRKQLQTALQRPTLTTPTTSKPSAVPVIASTSSGLLNSVRTLFPQEIIRSISGEILTLLDASPNQSKIAYQETVGQTERLWILDTQTSQMIQVLEWKTPPGAASSSLTWASDNQHFLFATGIPGRYNLYLGKNRTILGKPVLLGETAAHFAWSPTSLRFAYLSGANLFIQDVGGKTWPLKIGQTAKGGQGTSLQWSPDGTTLLFSIQRQSSFDIFTLALSEGQPVMQTLVSSPADDIQPSWSPDGRNVAFYVRSSTYDNKLAIVPSNRTRQPYIVANNVALMASGGPQWVSNSEVFYLEEKPGTTSLNTLHTVDITTGKHTAVPISMVFTQ